MNPAQHPEVSEDHQSLWALTFAPAIWALHFLLSYVLTAVWCGDAGRHGALGGAWAFTFGALTVVALTGIGLAVRRGWNIYQHGGTVPTHHRDTPEDRHRFLGLATLLLAALSGVATVYVALAVSLIRSCS